MRISLSLQCAPNSVLPMNNRYELSAILYRIIEQSSPEFSEWLHSKGYPSDGRFFKMFTFGNLNPLPYRLAQDGIIAQSGNVQWEISFCVEEIIEKFVAGIFQSQRFGLGNAQHKAVDFKITNVEILAQPNFQTTMRYQTLTPILIGERSSDERHETYLSPLDEGFERVFLHNLRGKAKAALGDAFVDSDSLSFRLLSPADKVKPKGFKIFKRGIAPMQYKPYLFDFELNAPAEWQRIGFFAGFGQDNALGLGLCKTMK
jgi:CRISPR-associated endoribonuclease Cas6